MDNAPVVIVGAGMAAYSLAREFRKLDKASALVIVTGDAGHAYAKPMLSNAFALGKEVRIAVDDAGVGIANFGHIVELRPDFVKLDASLVRGVNADPGRQALVVAMCEFARTAGFQLIAEGVETGEEAATLAHLGVALGQGYYVGRPQLPEHWAAG